MTPNHSLLRSLTCASLLVALSGCGARNDVARSDPESSPQGRYGLSMSVHRMELRCPSARSLDVEAHVRVYAPGSLRTDDAGLGGLNPPGPLTVAGAEMVTFPPGAGLDGIVVGTFDVVPFALTEDAVEADVRVVPGSYRDAPGRSLCEMCGRHLVLRVRFDDALDYGAYTVHGAILRCWY